MASTTEGKALDNKVQVYSNYSSVNSMRYITEIKGITPSLKVLK